MKILNKKITSITQFRDYLDKLKIYPWTRKIKKIVMHHTSSPVDSWQGRGSMLHYWNLYRSRGWKSGPHIFIAPNGIWLFTPILEKGTTSSPFLDKNGIHIEIVGQYYSDFPEDISICFYADKVINLLMEKFNLTPSDVVMHAAYIGGENCSRYVGKDWLFKIRDKKIVIV